MSLVAFALCFAPPVDATSWLCWDAYADSNCETPGMLTSWWGMQAADSKSGDEDTVEYDGGSDVISVLFGIIKSWSTRCISTDSCVWSGLYLGQCNDWDRNHHSKETCDLQDAQWKYSQDHCDELTLKLDRQPGDGSWCNSVWAKYSCGLSEYTEEPYERSFFDTKCNIPLSSIQDDVPKFSDYNALDNTACISRGRGASHGGGWDAAYYKRRCSGSDDTSPPTKHYFASNFGFPVLFPVCVFCAICSCWHFGCLCFKPKVRDVERLNNAGTELVGAEPSH